MPGTVGHSQYFNHTLFPSPASGLSRAPLSAAQTVHAQDHRQLRYAGLPASALRLTLSTAPRRPAKSKRAADMSAMANIPRVSRSGISTATISSAASALDRLGASPAVLEASAILKPPRQRKNPAQKAVRRYLYATQARPLPKHFIKNTGAVVNLLHNDLESKGPSQSLRSASYSRAAGACCNDAALERFLSYVANEIGVSGSDIDAGYARRMLRQTLRGLIESPDEAMPFAIADYDFLRAARRQQSVAGVHQEFIAHLKAIMPDLTSAAASWLGEELLAQYEPVAQRRDVPDTCIYGGLEWANIQAGIDTAAALGIDAAARPYEELIALAKNIDAAAHASAGLGAAFLAPQAAAALRYADAEGRIDLRSGRGIDPLDDAPTLLETALQTLDRKRTELRRQELAPLLKAQEFLVRPTPDRHKTAEKILRDLGLEPTAIGHAPPLTRQAIDACLSDRSLLQFYLDGCHRGLFQALAEAGRQPRDLPDLDALYDSEFSAYFEQLTQAMATLIAAAVERLDADDYLFWNNYPARLLQTRIGFTEQVPLASANFGGGPLFTYRTTQLAGTKALLFAVGDDESTRFYQVSFDASNAGVLHRIKPGAEGIDGFISAHRDAFFDSDALAQVPEHTRSLACDTQQLAAFDDSPGNTAQRARKAAAALNAFARDEWHALGYRISVHEQNMHEIRGFLLGLIPFYDCGDAIRNRPDEAPLPCAIDAAGLMPLTSTLARGGRLLMNLSKKLPPAMTREIGAVVTKGLSRRTVGGGRHVAIRGARRGGDHCRPRRPGFDRTGRSRLRNAIQSSQRPGQDNRHANQKTLCVTEHSERRPAHAAACGLAGKTERTAILVRRPTRSLVLAGKRQRCRKPAGDGLCRARRRWPLRQIRPAESADAQNLRPLYGAEFGCRRHAAHPA
ncbi:MAG: hypothetical protein JWP38_2436 [Herbaspirillum sp.]|nr:hypothetical protein [Herbaspirillum sp.]